MAGAGGGSAAVVVAVVDVEIANTSLFVTE